MNRPVRGVRIAVKKEALPGLRSLHSYTPTITGFVPSAKRQTRTASGASFKDRSEASLARHQGQSSNRHYNFCPTDANPELRILVDVRRIANPRDSRCANRQGHAPRSLADHLLGDGVTARIRTAPTMSRRNARDARGRKRSRARDKSEQETRATDPRRHRATRGRRGPSRDERRREACAARSAPIGNACCVPWTAFAPSRALARTQAEERRIGGPKSRCLIRDTKTPIFRWASGVGAWIN